MKLHRAVALVSLLLALAPVAQADSVMGVPVTAIGSSSPAVTNCPTLEGQVCYNTSTGATSFFIPLTSATSGVFGVTNVLGGTAGTFSDTGSGTPSALTMYLSFSPVALPVNAATLTFHFVDLDLAGVNDPAYFFETVQFFSANGIALTPLITANGQSGSSPLVFSVSGNSTSQTIFFPDVTSIVTDPFYVQLNFGSQWNNTGRNTPETMTATLVTTPVPEPGTLLLLGTGLAGLASQRRRPSRS